MSNKAIVLLGRIFVAAIFIFAGFGKLTSIGSTAGYFSSLGIPVPTLAAVAVGLLELLGGIAVLVGFRTRIAALALAVFTLAASFIAHFDFADQMQLSMFLKNLALAGGLLVLMAHGAGALSVDGRR